MGGYFSKTENEMATSLLNIDDMFEMHNMNVKLKDINETKTTKKYENLVFEGGSTKGLAYCGAIKTLGDYGILENIKRFAGSRAGAITATLLALKYTPEEIEKIVFNTNFDSFIDNEFNIVEDAVNIYRGFGVCTGNSFFNYITKIIKDKTGNEKYTFADLYKNTGVVLVITGTSITDKKTIFFNYETYPDMEIRLAVRISMSIPYLFEPIRYDNKMFVDGGMLDNYPLHVFDKGEINQKTLGLKLITPNDTEDKKLIKPIQDRDIKSIKDFSLALLNTMLVTANRNEVNDFYWSRTVSINVPDLSDINFNINNDLKNNLMECGRTGVVDFFAKSNYISL